MVDQKGVFKKPLSLSMEVGAAIPLAFGLAVHGLIGRCNLRKNQSVLIHSLDFVGLAAVKV
jgi:NADPH:quinone reductase-like Zn-dependent oxidoreductase